MPSLKSPFLPLKKENFQSSRTSAKKKDLLSSPASSLPLPISHKTSGNSFRGSKSGRRRRRRRELCFFSEPPPPPDVSDVGGKEGKPSQKSSPFLSLSLSSSPISSAFATRLLLLLPLSLPPPQTLPSLLSIRPSLLLLGWKSGFNAASHPPPVPKKEICKQHRDVDPKSTFWIFCVSMLSEIA